MAHSSDFVHTRWSVGARAGSNDAKEASAALSWLVDRYWDPLCRAAQRWGCTGHDAEDAVQDFCYRLVERRIDLAQVTMNRGRFRSWLLVVFRNAVHDRHDAARALKRGGAAIMVDARLADPTAPELSDLTFDRDWADNLLARAADRLAGEQQSLAEQQRFSRLRPYLTANANSATYQQICQALTCSEGAVKVALHRLRQRLRELARVEIRDTLVDPTQADIDDELATLAKALATESL